VERLKAKVEPLLTQVTVDSAPLPNSWTTQSVYTAAGPAGATAAARSFPKADTTSQADLDALRPHVNPATSASGWTGAAGPSCARLEGLADGALQAQAPGRGAAPPD